MEFSSENLQEGLDQECDQIPEIPPVKAKKVPSRKVLKWLISGIAVLLVLAILLPVINTFVVFPLKLHAAESLIEDKHYETAYYLLKQYEHNEDAQKLLNNFEVTYGYQKTTVYEADGSLYRTVIIERNSNGDIAYEVASDKDSLTVYTRSYRYDQYGNLTEEEYRNGTHTTVNKTEYVYGSNGNILEKTYYFPGAEHTRVFYSKYDERGNLIEKIDDYTDDNLRTRRLYTYDENNNCVLYVADTESDDGSGLREETVYDENGNMIRQTNYYDDEYISHLEYTYTPSGKKKSEALFKTAGLSYKIQYTYDSQDNLIEVENHNSSGSSRTVYKYDSQGNRVQVEYYKNNVFQYRYEYEYNLRGDICRELKYDKDGNGRIIKEYKYNLRGHKTNEATLTSAGKESEKTEIDYGLLGYISKRREYLLGNLEKEYEYDLFGNMTKMYATGYFDDFAIYGIQEIGKLIVEYDDPIILYKSETQ